MGAINVIDDVHVIFLKYASIQYISVYTYYLNNAAKIPFTFAYIFLFYKLYVHMAIYTCVTIVIPALKQK